MAYNEEGIINPPIDSLLEAADSKYGLVIFSAKRARQINAYYAQLHEGLFEYVGPLVDTQLNEKPLSTALREIDEGLLVTKTPEEVAAEAPAVPAKDPAAAAELLADLDSVFGAADSGSLDASSEPGPGSVGNSN